MMKKTIFCLALVLIVSSVCFGKKRKKECKRKAMCAKLKEQETTLADLIKRVENLEKEPATPAPAQRDGFDISFSGTKEDHVTTDRVVPPLHAFSICMWIKVSLQEEDWVVPLLMYGSEKRPGIAVIYSQDVKNRKELLEVFTAEQVQERAGPVGLEENHIGEWQHVCATWDNTAGITMVYSNGVKVLTSEEMGKGVVITPEEATLGKTLGFGVYKGDISGFNMWDQVLSDDEISRMATECSSGEGNVLKWSDFRSGVQGNAKVVEPSTCSP